MSSISLSSATYKTTTAALEFRFDYTGDLLSSEGQYKVRVWFRKQSETDADPDDIPATAWTLAPDTTSTKYCEVNFSPDPS